MAETKSIAMTAPAGGMEPLRGKMMEGFSSLQGFMRQPAFVRAAPMILVSLVIIAGLALIYLLREPAMVTLFPKLGDEDKAQIMQLLEAQGIKAKLEGSTGQVAVPRAEFHRAKMVLAANGLPKAAASGYEMLTQMPLGVSRSVEQAKLKQAQEAELARSIMEIRDVEGARVHLAIPERTAFVRDQAPPSASVFLKLSPGRSLAQGQIQSITHLVSSSVPFLPVANVTVVDQFGTLLTTPQRDSELGLTAQQLEHKLRVERLLRERISNLLTPIVGPGNANSEVNVDMDFTRQEQTREIYDPQNQAVRSQQETIQESADQRARGVPGATSNQPPTTPQLAAQPPQAGAANSNATQNKSSTSVRNFEVSREVRSVRPAMGDIKRISVAVLLRAGTTTDAEGRTVEKPISDQEKERLTSLLQDAVGFDSARGDKVTIISSNFADEVKMPTKSWYDAPWLEDAIKQVVILLILAVIVLGALKPFLNRLMDGAMIATARVDEPIIGEGESIEVREGETLEDIKARLKPKKSAISAELLDTANTYDDKVTLIRMLVGDDAGRVTAVLKSLIKRDLP
ncbi:MAG: flagellar M-ring protein FliF [Beijerinckiaceae bacterium]|nr:flagellar M-ring protein FliF [Beijerinckiaceae bacterium]